MSFIYNILRILQNNPKKPHSSLAKSPEELEGNNFCANPVDGHIYSSSNTWTKYGAETPEKTGAVASKALVLLTPQGQIPSRMPIEKIAELVRQVDALVIDAFQDAEKVGEILLQITLSTSNNPQVQISARGEVDEDKAAALFPAIGAIEGYQTTTDTVVFQLHYTLNM
jgi:hypothetical protein